MHKNYFGKERKSLFDWMSTEWQREGPVVCFLEGFPGVGKSELAGEIATEIAKSTEWVAISYEVPDRPNMQLTDVWLDIADMLATKNLPKMQEIMLGEQSPNLAYALEKALTRKVLIVIDEIQRLFEPNSGRPIESLMGITAFLKNRPTLPGRLLLLSDRLVERERWSETFAIRSMHALAPDEAQQLLDDRLGIDLIDDVPAERKADILRVLGFNPRAIETLVSTLHYEPLEEIVGSNPGIWEVQDRDVSPEFLSKLERQLLERTLTHLDSLHLKRLTLLAVHRSSFEVAAFELVCSSIRKEWRDLRNSLITRFLIRHSKSFYSLHPMVREISLARLRKNPGELKQAHSNAADYYLRHFRAQNIVLRGSRLTVSYAELRYHLYQSQRETDLQEVTWRVSDHIGQEFSWNSPVPEDKELLNEQIGLLSTLLRFDGAAWLQHYLARLLIARNNVNDSEVALMHAERAALPSGNANYWILVIHLQEEVHGKERAIKALLDAVRKIDQNSNSASFYHFGAELFQRNGEIDEAIKFLRSSLLVVAPDKALSSLYIKAANIIAEHRNLTDSIDLLSEGLKIIPSDKDLSSLYYRLAELKCEYGDRQEGLTLLDEGIEKIPCDKGLAPLFLLKANILREEQQLAAALNTLMRGVEKIPADKGHNHICGLAFEILYEMNRKEEAILFLKDRIKVLGGNFGGPSLEKLLVKHMESKIQEDQEEAVSEARLSEDVGNKRSALVIATEWFSRHGGLSTFNRNLCRELAKHEINVVCVVPKVTPEEVEAAAIDGVTLISGPPSLSTDPLNGLYRKLTLPINPDVVIGHGRITGGVARAQVQDNFIKAARVHFIHMASGEIEWFKGKDDAALIAETREREELELAATSNIVAAVGPRLCREIGNLLQSRETKPIVQEFLPGCEALQAPRVCPPQIHCLLLGRAEDMELKGLDIAARALSIASNKSSRILELQPELIVRGAPRGTGVELRNALRNLTTEFEIPIRIREYSSDESDIEADLRRASLLLMPSRKEGFGLVALEALALGTPILVSDQSGVAEIIKRYLPAVEANKIVVPTFDSLERSAESWSRAIELQLADREAAFQRAWELSRRFYEESNWARSTRYLLDELMLNLN